MESFRGRRQRRHQGICASPLAGNAAYASHCFVYLALSIVAISAGCTPNGEAGHSQTNRPPHIRSANIFPNPPTKNRLVGLQVDANDPDGDPIAFRYRWLVNSSPIIGQIGSTVNVGMLKRNDRLAVEIIPYDGKSKGALFRTKEVGIGNAVPEVTSITMDPVSVHVGNPIHVKAQGSDADGDPIEYRFRWWRNNEEISGGEEDVLETATFTRGDRIMVQVTPYDNAGSRGKAKLSEPTIIINSSPQIASTPTSPTTTKGRYEYTVTAIDSDGDTLDYALETGPAGMKIDKTSGQIEWDIPADAKGVHHARIKVTDPEGAFAFQEFDLTFAAHAAASGQSSP